MALLRERELVLACALVVACGPAAGPGHGADHALQELDARVVRARERIRAGEVVEGLAALDAWLEAVGTPVSARLEAHRWAAHANTLLGQPEEALAHLDAAAEVDSDDAWLHYARGTALHTIGDYERALAAYDRALDADPRHVKAAQWSGDTLGLLGRPAEAIVRYDHALEVLASADEVEVASWGGDLPDLRRRSLLGRADARDALGDHAAAESDRSAARDDPQPPR